MSKRIPEVKAWDDGTAVMEKNCVPMWHLGCAAINALDAENLRLTLAQPVYSRRQLQTRLERAEAEDTELRKQNDILATARRLEEAERRQAEATIERLKVCGTCHMWQPVPDADDTYCCTCIIIGADPAYPHSRCDRWAERSTP